MDSTTGRDGKMRTYPWPLISAEKLETQNGIRKSRNVCQRFDECGASFLMLSSNAIPMTALIPREFTQRPGELSKWTTTVTKYQIR